ncbi:MAG TPA: hypothetical protein VMM76_03920 [Pirellulaceae bacterium]|nr:hypothetical protein [Pirellulaceae bacterium]
MTTVPKPVRRPDTSGMHVSRFDQVASLVVALLIMVGVAVVGMFIIWLTATLVFKSRSVPVKLVENVPGRGDHAEGFERDLEAPGMEEMPELAEPQLEVAMEAMTEAVSSVAAAMDSVSLPSDATSKGEGGMGDSRPPGPLGEGDNIIPRWERWEIRFESSSESAYARQLDAFKIELGAAGGGKKNVDYARNLAKGKPDTYSGPGDKEQRLYMTWRGGSLQKFDQNLLRKAGVNISNRLLMQFYPEAVEDQLAWIEKAHADKQNKTLQEYLKTVFELKPKGSSWEFVVAEMRFRPKPK